MNTKLLRSRRGFTLIELLVVITLIAILAVAVLAAINPVEQRRKALDTGYQNAAAQTVAAMERFFTTYGCWPHLATISGAQVTCGTTGTLDTNVVTKLVSVGEIKDPKIKTQLDTAGLSTGIIVDASDIAHVCFVPVSKAMKGKAKYKITTGVISTGTDNTFTLYCVPDGD